MEDFTMENKTNKPHLLTLDNRRKLCLTGVEDVLGFNEEMISAVTPLGNLIIRGSKLHISKLSLDSGEVDVEGVVDSLQYVHNKREKSFVQRLFS